MGRRLSVEKRVSRFLIGIGLLSLATLMIRQILAGYSFSRIIRYPSIYSVGIAVVLLLISTFFLPVISNRILQVVLIFSIGIFSTLDDFESWYGMGLIATALILSFKYGFFREFLIFKVALISLIILVLVELSSSMKNDKELMFFGVEAIIFYSFFMGIIFICYFDETLKAKTQIDQLKRKRKDFEGELERLSKQIEELDEEKTPFDLSGYELTKAEYDVLECLVKYRASTIEIGKILGKAEMSVRVQLKGVYRKLGVNGRYEAIELCRHNF